MRRAYFSHSPLPPRDGTGERGVERHRTRDIYLRKFVQGNGLRVFGEEKLENTRNKILTAAEYKKAVPLEYTLCASRLHEYTIC